MDKEIVLYWRILLVVSVGLFTDGYFLYIASATEPMLKIWFMLSDLQSGLLQSSAPIGTILGALLCSPLIDRYGRKALLLIDIGIFIVASIWLFFANSFDLVLLARYLTGIGVGIGYPIYAAYLTENTPLNKHGKIVAIGMFVNVLALPIASLAAYYLYQKYNLGAWKYIFLSGLIPTILCFFIRYGLSESKPWLSLDANKRNESFFVRYSHLFQPQFLRYTIILSLCWLIMDISYYGISLFTTDILVAFHNSMTIKQSALLSLNSLWDTLVVNFFAALGALLAIFCVERYSNYKLQKYGFYISGLSLLALSYIPLTHNLNYLILCFAVYNIAINIGPDVTTYLLPAEVYPSEFRATGAGFSAGVAKVGAFIGTTTLPLMIDFIHVSGVLVILGGSLLLAGYITNFIVQKKVSKINVE